MNVVVMPKKSIRRTFTHMAVNEESIKSILYYPSKQSRRQESLANGQHHPCYINDHWYCAHDCLFPHCRCSELPVKALQRKLKYQSVYIIVRFRICVSINWLAYTQLKSIFPKSFHLTFDILYQQKMDRLLRIQT